MKKLMFWTRVVVAGMGALTPTLLSFLTADMQVLFTGLTVFLAVGYLLRAGVLFALGGLVGYLYKDESSPLKLFQLGVATPALLTIFISSQNPVEPMKVSLNPTFATEVCASTGTIVRVSTRAVNVSTNTVNVSTNTVDVSTEVVETPVQQMFRGFFAKRWYKHYAVKLSTGGGKICR